LTEERKNQKKARFEVKTFPIPFALGESKNNITFTTNTPTKPSKEQIINQAFKFHSQGNISEAAKYYQYFINEGFKDHRVLSNYGVILSDLGRLEEAEKLYYKAIEIKPHFTEVYYNLGKTLKDLGKLKEAELTTRKAILLKPDYAEAHHNLGIILKDIGNFKEAALSTRKAIEINPDLVEAYISLAEILFDMGENEEANKLEWKAIEINPSFPFLKSYRQNAKVIKKTAFFLHSFYILNHFLPTIEINTKNFEILVSEKLDKLSLKKIQKVLVNKDIKVRFFQELIDNNLIYEKLVSANAFDTIHIIENKENKKIKRTVPYIKLFGKKNIRFMYTAGKNKWNFSYWNKYYDGILCYGPYHENKFKIRHNIATAQMGYPRFDKYFKPGFERNNLIKKFKCDPNKKTVVWLTTWTDLSSVDKYLKSISSLRIDYNVVMRPHPNMKVNEPDKFKKIFNEEFNYIDDDDDDNVRLFALADLMLFDYGGSMFGALYLNKNFAFLEMSLETKNHIHLGNKASEDYLKSFFPERIAKPENLQSICEFCLENPPSDSIIKSLREEFFNTNYQGNSGKRAYDLLISKNWIK